MNRLNKLVISLMLCGAVTAYGKSMLETVAVQAQSIWQQPSRAIKIACGAVAAAAVGYRLWRKFQVPQSPENVNSTQVSGHHQDECERKRRLDTLQSVTVLSAPAATGCAAQKLDSSSLMMPDAQDYHSYYAPQSNQDTSWQQTKKYQEDARLELAPSVAAAVAAPEPVRVSAFAPGTVTNIAVTLDPVVAVSSAAIDDKHKSAVAVGAAQDNSASTKHVQTLIAEVEAGLAIHLDRKKEIDAMHTLVNKFHRWQSELRTNIRDLEGDAIAQKRLMRLLRTLEERFTDRIMPWNRGQEIVERLSGARAVAIDGVIEDYLAKGVDENLQNVFAIAWYSYALAAKKTQSFQEGSFQVQDVNGALLRYLLAVNPTKRISSHRHDVRDVQHYEIFVPHVHRDKDGWLLPNNNYTLLFFDLQNGYIFIKPEAHSVSTLRDWGLHALGFAGSVLRKITGGNDREGYRKEHIPEPVKKAFKNFLNATYPSYQGMLARFMRGNPITHYEKLFTHVGMKGIWPIINKIRRESAPSAEIDSALNKLTNLLEAHDCHDVRFGNEVVLRNENYEPLW